MSLLNYYLHKTEDLHIFKEHVQYHTFRCVYMIHNDEASVRINYTVNKEILHNLKEIRIRFSGQQAICLHDLPIYTIYKNQLGQSDVHGLTSCSLN